jgi:Tfp pilus assembly protein PilN
MSTPTDRPATLTLPVPEQSAAVARALRIPQIAADLLPLEIVDARRDRRVRRMVLAALAAFVAVLAAWYALTNYQTGQARDALTSAEDAGQAVQRQQRAFAEVVSIQAESRVTREQLASLFATDLRWTRLLGAVESAAPDGVVLTGVSTTITQSSAATGGVAAVTLPNTTGDKLVGTVAVSGVALTKPQVAAYLDALGKVKGLGNPILGGATLHDGKLQFNLQLDLTAAALGGRFSAVAGSGGN